MRKDFTLYRLEYNEKLGWNPYRSHMCRHYYMVLYYMFNMGMPMLSDNSKEDLYDCLAQLDFRPNDWSPLDTLLISRHLQ